jgi:glycosyltransferase involved in cell wall biosynthesis
MVVVGRGDSIGTLKPLARRLGVEDRLTFTGSLAHADLLTLLHGAAALVFPPLIEGFGFPVLEAMSAGCPVIASSCPTLVEIGGRAAIFCDPERSEDFAAAMVSVLNDASLRSDLRERGIERAAAFSWDRCAARTLDVYQALLDPVRHEDHVAAATR